MSMGLGKIGFDQVKISKNLFTEPSLIFLILSNLITMAAAIFQHWNVNDLMLAYWGQSVIIGLASFIKILTLKNFDSSGMTMNGKIIDVSSAAKNTAAFFFLIHYGIFHLVYGMFLISFSAAGSSSSINFLSIFSIWGLFFINHFISLISHWPKERETKQNLGKMMFFPYFRIIPMHLTIIFGGAAGLLHKSLAILIFMGLKTFADLAMHLVEHQKT